jgi:hypothetical protein
MSVMDIVGVYRAAGKLCIWIRLVSAVTKAVVVALSLWTAGLDPGLVHMEFLVYKLTLRQCFPPSTWVSRGTALKVVTSRFRFPMVPLEFSLTLFFRPHYGPRVDSASNRVEYQEYFLVVKAAGAFG